MKFAYLPLISLWFPQLEAYRISHVWTTISFFFVQISLLNARLNAKVNARLDDKFDASLEGIMSVAALLKQPQQLCDGYLVAAVSVLPSRPRFQMVLRRRLGTSAGASS